MISQRDPQEMKDHLLRDRLDAKVEIRLVLDRLAERYQIAPREVTRAMGSIDDMLSDLTYELERELDDEIDARRD